MLPMSILLRARNLEKWFLAFGQISLITEQLFIDFNPLVGGHRLHNERIVRSSGCLSILDQNPFSVNRILLMELCSDFY